MGSVDKRQVKKRGVSMASAGLFLALGVGYVFNFLGFQTVTTTRFLWAVGVTLAVQGLLWAVVQVGWDRHISWDPHFMYVPLATASVLLVWYSYLAPSVRAALLMAWFAGPILLAGLVGFSGIVIMSALMAAGYLATGIMLLNQGVAVSLPFEAAVAVVFLIINTYTGIVFERLKREREERKVLEARLAELAITDPLTGLYNRRHFEEILRAEVGRIRRYGGHCSLAMIDLDFFKNYNDTLGHLAGDALLRELAALLRGHLRVSDVLARYGGEEFGLIMVNTPKDEAILAMERLRALVEEYPFRGGGIQPFGRLTVSVGIASSPADGTDYEELVQKADAALYAAKRMGRNQIQAAVLT